MKTKKQILDALADYEGDEVFDEDLGWKEALEWVLD